MTVVYREYMQTDDWKRKRVAALHRSMKSPRRRSRYASGPCCEVCGRAGFAYKNRIEDWRLQVRDANGLEVHHTHYRNLGNEAPNDLVVLCTDACFYDAYWRLSPERRRQVPLPRRVGCHERTHDDPEFRAVVDEFVRIRRY